MIFYECNDDTAALQRRVFANCVMALYLLKVHLQNVSFYTSNSKNAKFWVVTLVANERYLLLTKYFSGYQIKKNEIGWACSTWWEGRGDMHTGFRWGDLRGGDHLEDTGVDGSIILKWTFRNAVMILQVSYNAGSFLAGWGTVSLSGMTLLYGVR